MIRRAIQVQRRKVGRAKGFDYDAFSDDQLSDVWQYNLFPNIIISFTPGHSWIMRVRPHATDPGRCEFDKLSLVMFADPELLADEATTDLPGEISLDDKRTHRTHIGIDGVKPEGYVRPDRDIFDYAEVIAGRKTMTDTIDQDVELLSNVQAGMRSDAFDTTWLNDDEMRVQHFHNEVVRKING